jgi:hypothetical protein
MEGFVYRALHTKANRERFKNRYLRTVRKILCSQTKLASRHQDPIVEIKDDALSVTFFKRAGKTITWQVLGGHSAQAQSTQIITPFDRRAVNHFRPSKYCVAGKAGSNVPSTIDSRHKKRIAKSIERQ